MTSVLPVLNRLSQLTNDLVNDNLISDITSSPLLLNHQLITATIGNPYGIMNAMIIEEPTSDQETTNDDLEIFQCLNQPTFKEICDFFLDSAMIRTIPSPNLFLPEVKPGIILPNNTKANYLPSLRQWLRELKVNIDLIAELRIISFFNEAFSLIKFDSSEECIDAFTKLSSIEPRVAYCYDGTDMLNSNWYPVLIRNVPIGLSIEDIKLNYYKDYEEEITRVIGPAMIGSVNACLIIVKSIEIAERMCYYTKVTHKDIKAHLHYRICKVRYNKDKSHFANYFDEAKGIEANTFLMPPKLFGRKKKEMSIIDVLNSEERKSRMERIKIEKERRRKDKEKQRTSETSNDKLKKLINESKA